MRQAIPVIAALLSACGPSRSADAPDEVPLGDGRTIATSAAALTELVTSRAYVEWPAEAAAHPSAGPHGRVRTFVNPALRESLRAGNAEHPAGSIAVKELFGSGSEITGHAVEVKGPQSGWIFFEGFADRGYADPYYFVGADNLCGSCHSGGADFVMTPGDAFP